MAEQEKLLAEERARREMEMLVKEAGLDSIGAGEIEELEAL